jgi:hypothetical protein
VRRSVIALVALGALLYGCATPWPQVAAKADPVFAHRGRPILKVDLLPIDLQLWVDQASRGAPDTLRAAAESEIIGAITTALYQRRYAVGGVIDWQGGFVGPDGARAQAMDRAALAVTVDSLSTYGTAASRSDGLPVPYLPARLGVATGADATLYVGGWSFVGDDEDETGKVLTYVLIGVVIIAVVAVIAIAASKHGGGGGGSAVGRVAEGAGKALVSAGRFALTTGARVAADVTRVMVTDPRVLDLAIRSADAFGHTETHLELCDTRPDWQAEERHDGRSAMYLEMTLVDNQTGNVLWHARQQFPASGASKGQVDHAVASMLESLPPAP